MKTELKKETNLSGIFMTPLLLTTALAFTAYGDVAQAAATDNDPNLALQPAAPASAAMQAQNPVVQLKAPSAASAAVGAASGPAAVVPAAAPASVPAAVPAAAPPAPPAPMPAVATALTTTAEAEVSDAEYKAYSFALKNVDGVVFDKHLNARPIPNLWQAPDTSRKKNTRLTNKARDQFVDLGVSASDRFEVVTYNKANEHANVVVFKDNKPESYTVVGKRGHYTATPAFCELLRVQTKSASFAELKERAVTCKTFFDRPSADEKTNKAISDMRQELFDAHRRNISLMKSSVAKPLIDANIKIDEDNRFEKAMKVLAGKDIKNPMISVKPRTILTATGSPEEAQDRAVLSELGEACGNLWADGSGATITAPPANKGGAPASGKTTAQ